METAPLALPANETASGVTVHRVWTTRFGRGTLPGRAMDYLTFYLSALWRLARLADRNTILVAKTDPPMISVVAALAARGSGARLVNWRRICFPKWRRGRARLCSQPHRPRTINCLQMVSAPIR